MVAGRSAIALGGVDHHLRRALYSEGLLSKALVYTLLLLRCFFQHPPFFHLGICRYRLGLGRYATKHGMDVCR
jgi:hypothetical protein